MQLRRLSDREQRVSADFDWAQHAPEVQQNPAHYGQFVVVHNKQVVAVGSDRQALVEQTANEIGMPWQELVVIVVTGQEVTEIPH
jgi:hypothetical protein